MCFDPRMPGSDALFRAAREHRDGNSNSVAIPAKCPGCGSGDVGSDAGDPNWWLCKGCGLKWEREVSPARAERLARITEMGEFLDVGPDGDEDDPAAILAECARGHDGFAGSIGAWLAERRAARERLHESCRRMLEEIAREDAEREARLARRAEARNRWAGEAWCVVIVALIAGLAWTTWHSPAPSPITAPGPPATPTKGNDR